MKILLRLSIACLGIAVMYLESTFTPEPGVGFAIGFGLMILAALLD